MGREEFEALVEEDVLAGQLEEEEDDDVEEEVDEDEDGADKMADRISVKKVSGIFGHCEILLPAKRV